MSTTNIRPVEESDLERLLAWRNHPEVRLNMFHPEPIDLDTHRRWFEKVRANPLIHPYLFDGGDGALGFFRLDERAGQRSGEWGFYAAPDAPPGTGRRLGAAAIAQAFGPLGWHRLTGWTLASNERSIKMHLALGFRQEGRMREYHRVDTHFVDVCCFGLLRSEWASTQESLP
jgi:UDP-4-amino-4,6-dideoxy-N-acetyl-beta-L-altrosamine N-acetyltransferase